MENENNLSPLITIVIIIITTMLLVTISQVKAAGGPTDYNSEPTNIVEGPIYCTADCHKVEMTVCTVAAEDGCKKVLTEPHIKYCPN